MKYVLERERIYVDGSVTMKISDETGCKQNEGRGRGFEGG